MDVRAFLQNSVISTINPETASNRRHEVSQLTPSLRRGVGMMLHDMAVSHPSFAAKVSGLKYEKPATMERIGTGYNSTVFRVGESQVLKVMHRTAWLSHEGRRSLASRYEDEHAKLRSYLGDVVIPHQVIIDTHPLFPGLEAVQITQEYKSGPNLHIVSEKDDEIRVKVDAIRAEQPTVGAQLVELISNGRKLYADEHLLPDTFGVGNLIVSSAGSLQLIDGQPISTTEIPAQRRILNHIDAIDSAFSL